MVRDNRVPAFAGWRACENVLVNESVDAMSYLNTIQSPSVLKKYTMQELEGLAQEIRAIIIETVSRNGGHLASNLGVVEITLALHRCFSMPDDQIIWDVGHQCYAHKLVTGRFNCFHTLRQFEGISGFPKTSESPYDCFDTGHSGTSISVALGMAVQRDLAGLAHKVIAVVGDASLTNGMALEAMNHAGFLGNDFIVVLNDNERSISKNVGAYSKHLNKLRLQLVRKQGKQKTVQGEMLQRLLGSPAFQIKEKLRHLLTPSRTGSVFQELGFMYFGPVDGHDMHALCEVLDSVKDLKGPVMVHAVTRKGKGYKYSEENAAKFHGIGCFNSFSGEVEECPKQPTYTQVFGQALIDLAREDKRIIAVTAAMKDGTGLREFKKEFPDRFFDVGIAEEHAVTFAAGLARAGARPIVAIYSTFLQRAYDQILHDVCLQKLPVKFLIDRAGIVGEDGPTHQGVFDLSYLRSMPNMVIMAPKDRKEFQAMIKFAVAFDDGPIAVRYPRGDCPDIAFPATDTALELGKAEVLAQGETVTLVAIGSTVHSAVLAAGIMKKQGLNPTVINARFVKPLDTGMLDKLAAESAPVVIIEENVVAGGFGSAVMEYVTENGKRPVRMKRIGLPDVFIEQGPQSVLRGKYGLSPEVIANSVMRFADTSGESGE